MEAEQARAAALKEQAEADAAKAEAEAEAQRVEEATLKAAESHAQAEAAYAALHAPEPEPEPEEEPVEVEELEWAKKLRTALEDKGPVLSFTQMSQLARCAGRAKRQYLEGRLTVAVFECKELKDIDGRSQTK